MNIYLVITFGGLLGILGHSLKVVNSINKRYDSTDFKTVFAEYWKHDKLALLTSMFSFAILLYVSSEFVNLNHLEDTHDSLKERLINFKIATFIKTSSVIAGWFSDSIVYGFMGVTEKRIKKSLDELKPKE
jgi:hypothetical protein